MARYTITNLAEEIPFEVENGAWRIVQNAKNLLMTRVGELPFDRLRGFDASLYNKPMDQFRAELPREVDRLLIWEPRAKMISAEASILEKQSPKDARENEILITVVIEVKD